MHKFFLIISLFIKIYSYNKTSLQYNFSLELNKRNFIPYRLKFSSGKNISLSIPNLYDLKGSRINNGIGKSFLLFDNKGKEITSFLKDYTINSVMGYTLNKDKYYILDQGKIFENKTIENNSPKIIVCNTNGQDVKNYSFEGIPLENHILTDIAVDHHGKYAYIIDSGNLKLGNVYEPGIIVVDLLSDKKKFYKVLNNHKSFIGFESQQSKTNIDIYDFIGIDNIQISCDDETIYYSSSKKKELYSVSTKDILKAIEKYKNSNNNYEVLQDKFEVNTVALNFKIKNFILSSKGNIFMINSDSKNVEVSFNLNSNLPSHNFEFDSKINLKDNIKLNQPCSLDIYNGTLYLLDNSSNSLNIYFTDLKKDEYNSNMGCTIFFFKIDFSVIFLFVWFLIILVFAILIIIEKSWLQIENSNPIENEKEIKELNRKLNEED